MRAGALERLRRPRPGSLGGALLALALLLGSAAAAARPARGGTPAPREGDEIAAGRRIYREGVLPSGRSLEGGAQAGIRRTGADAACMGCHRRSGYGTSEGPIVIPPVTGPSLFGWREVPPPVTAAAPPTRMAPANAGVASQAARLAARRARVAALTGTRRRPPYDDAALARAIRDGVDVTGRPLGPGMPRYALGDGDMKALVAYLRTLSSEPAPGVTGEELHFATVVQPGVDPGQRRAMLEVLQAFVHDKNAGTRGEAQRKAAGTERGYRSYRKWVLHVWDLTGPAERWPDQLESLYARQPVFALLGGLASASWGAVHAFSERHGVPCLFPQVDLPATEPGFYTVYLSRGIPLEAAALSRYLRDRGERGPVTQVFRREAASAAAAAAFREAMPGASLQEHELDGAPTREFWARLARERPGATLVLWLRAEDLAEAGALTEPGSPAADVFLSSTLLTGGTPGIAAGGDRVRLVFPLDLPRTRGARLLRVKRWLHEKGIALAEEKVQMNAYFAVAVAADAMSHVSDLFSREYLVERVEHMVGNTVTPSIYPRVSLGPDQRFASKGSFIVRVAGRGKGDYEPVSGWITP